MRQSVIPRPPRRIRRSSGLLLALLLPLQCLGWSMSGHRVIADISWLHLTPAARQAAYDLLMQHPDLKRGFLAEMPEDLPPVERPRWLFRHAAAWPDVVRSYEDIDPAAHERFHRGTWHYINRVLWIDEDAERRWSDRLRVSLSTQPPDTVVREMNVVQAIKAHVDRLADKQAAPADKAVSLAWLLHLIADIHQPLHSTALFGLRGAEAGGDRGGNLVCLAGIGDIDNLHWFWDSRVFMDEDPAAIESRALALLIEQAPPLAAAATDLGVDAWTAESANLAVDTVYTPEVLAAAKRIVNGRHCSEESAGRISLGIGYIERAQSVAEKRAVLAGLRMARVLERALR